ncbi:Y-family DNA polymerase [Taibaiella koreensis]|uniref:Y-family DNA polymerase n=1 Tax=Taibaiella koreensis TaxID=1268548 RepID=UPI001F09DDEF|nr:DNA polymerase Y family protein [Taibaiella koreensis]
MSIWLPFAVTDKMTALQPEREKLPFVLAAAQRGRMIIQHANPVASGKGICAGMAAADARAILPDLEVLPYAEGFTEQLLRELALWCLRFTPVAAIDLPDGLLLDISGCAHLWGGEATYREDILAQLTWLGYRVRAAVADTIGAAWAMARFGAEPGIVPPGNPMDALLPLPPEALRLDTLLRDKMRKLGLRHIGSFIHMPRTVLRRRFGQALLHRIDQAQGQAIELPEPVQAPATFCERLPCPEPIRTANAIAFALKTLLERLCRQLLREGQGLRSAELKAYRIDGNVQQIAIGTNRPVRNPMHLFKLLEQKIACIAPGLGIELFLLEAPVVAPLSVQQETLWAAWGSNGENTALAHLLDRVAGRVGAGAIRRYLPAEHYWPGRSIKLAASLAETPATDWRCDRPRPIYLLPEPERIEVSVPLPDYPPLLFIHKGQRYKITKADGPERIEQEWWLEQGLVRDYYVVEDEEGARYWLFRSGRYEADEPEWFLHGFFA